MNASKAFRKPLRWVGGAAAVGFACLSYIYLTLPDVRLLRTSNPSTTAFMEIRADAARDKGQKPRRVQRWIGYNRVSPNLKRAVLVAEDDAFFDHEGVDFEQLQQSLEVDWARGSLVRGGSTITQQLAKNLYLSPSKNPLRKLRELVLARRLEAELSKSRILELYLNVIEWGDGIYGAEAAARTYFYRSAAELDPSSSALLAGAIVNPRLLNPARPTTRLRRRQQLILGRMGSVTPPPAEPAAPSAEVSATPPAEEAAPPPADEVVQPSADEAAPPPAGEVATPLEGVTPPEGTVEPAPAAVAR